MLDQGVLQAIWSILYTEGSFAPNSTHLSPLLGAFYRGMTVRIVVIEVPPALAADRVGSRGMGSSRLDAMERCDVLERLTRAEGLPAVIRDAARGAGLEVDVLDGSADIDSVVAELRRIMQAIGGDRDRARGTSPSRTTPV